VSYTVHCRTCRKTWYLLHRAAKREAGRLGMRVYACPSGTGWHLTFRSKRERRRRLRRKGIAW
jgi:hypothetical protein